MLSINDLREALRPIYTKLFFIVGRCILKKVQNDANDTQRADVDYLGESLTKRERIQEYGFDTYPPTGDEAECVALFVNGNRDQGIVIKIANRKYRPTDLDDGAVCMYSKDSNDSNNNRITIKPDNTIEIKTADGNLITIDSSGIVITDKNNNKIETTSTGMKLTDKNAKTLELSAVGLTMLGGTEAYVKGTTHQVALSALTASIAAIVPAGSSAANIASIQAAFATFAGTLANMNSTEIKGK
jgi:phage baseplate assembly protein V